jgi:hypothetical protein
MSDDDGPDISRRMVLYGLAAGGIGAGSGAMTGATLSDTEAFTANLFSSGEVDLETCWENKTESACTPDDADPEIDLGEVSTVGDGGSGLIRVELPDDDANNPAWVCLRASCPSDPPTGLEKNLTVRVWRDKKRNGECDAERDTDEELLAFGSLCEVLTTLNDGILVDGDTSTSDPDPFEPGEEACIGFEWYLSETLDQDDAVDIDFDLRATQSRSTTPEDVCQPQTCGVTCDGDSTSKEISFVSFCTSGGFDSPDQDPITSISTAKLNTDGEEVAVDWESEEPVDTVVIKTGKVGNVEAKKALYTFDAGGATFGTTELDTTTGAPDPGGNQSASSPCPDGSSGVKYEYENESWVKD